MWLIIFLLIDSQVVEPVEKDKGKYSIVITDPENSHKRTLDLSGDGQYFQYFSSLISFPPESIPVFIDNSVKRG